VCLLVLGGSHEAAADGWKIQLQSVKALGLGYAGRALAEDAATVWLNPAGMTRLEGDWSMTLGGVFLPFTLDYTDRGSLSVLGQPLSGPASTNGGSPASVPHMYVVHRVSDRWWIGGGLNFPHGLADDYEQLWVGRYHATKSELRVANLNAVAGMKVTDTVSIAAGLDVQRSTATLANMIDFGSFGAAVGLPLAPQAHDGRIELNSSDWAVGYDLSLAWQVSPALRFASTYRSEIEHTLQGVAEFVLPPSAGIFGAGGAFTVTDATASLPMPGELSGSVAYSFGPKWIVVGDVTWTNWSPFERLTVTFENPAQAPLSQDAAYEDSIRSAIGVIYRTNATWTFRAGVLYEDTPVPDATRTPRLPEADNVGMSLGGSVRLNTTWDLDFSWSHLFPHDAPIRLVDPNAGLLYGDVRWKTDALAVGLNARF
jgi:long-chain fatty acid transport protein